MVDDGREAEEREEREERERRMRERMRSEEAIDADGEPWLCGMWGRLKKEGFLAGKIDTWRCSIGCHEVTCNFVIEG